MSRKRSRRKNSQKRTNRSIAPNMESLEPRLLLSTLVLDGTDLQFTSAGGAANTATISESVDGTTQINDPNEVITSVPAGWAGAGTNTVTGPSADYDQITVDLGDLDDSLTIDLAVLSTADFANGLSYAGGTGTDSLSLSGDNGGGGITTVTYSPTNVTDGSVDIDGTAVSFTGLSPITDTTTATNLVLNGTAGADTITIVDGSAGTQVTGDTFGNYDFANKTNVTINGLGEADDITLNNPTPAAGLNSLTINGGDADDSFTATSVDVATTINGDAGNDSVDVTSANLNATLTVNGGDPAFPADPGDSLVYDGGGNDATVTSSGAGDGTISRAGVSDVNYTSIEEVSSVNGSLDPASTPARPTPSPIPSSWSSSTARSCRSASTARSSARWIWTRPTRSPSPARTTTTR